MMTPNDQSLIAALLDLAADTFGNHGCNDYELADTPENRLLVQRMNEYDGMEGEDAEWVNLSGGKIIVGDDSLMRFYAAVLKGEVTL